MRRIFYYFSILVAIASFLVPFSTNAISIGSLGGLTGDTYYGGMHLFSFGASVCNCSGTNLHYIIDYKSNSLLILYKGPTSTFVTGSPRGQYQLGGYNVGVKKCTMIADPCLLVGTARGTYTSNPVTGSSFIDENVRSGVTAFWRGFMPTENDYANASSAFIKNALLEIRA